MTPPPIDDHVRLEDVGEARAGARRAGRRSARRRSIASRVAGRCASLGHRLAVDRPLGERLAERRVGLAFGRRLALPAERRARGERLDAAVVGAVALAGRPVDLRSRCGRARRRPRSSRGRARRPRIRPPPIPVPIGQHHHVRLAPRRRRRGTRPGRRRWRRCRRRPAGRPARATRSRIGRSVDRQVDRGTATPRSWSIVAGIPSPTAQHVGARLLRLRHLAAEHLDQLAPRSGRSRPRGSRRGPAGRRRRRRRASWCRPGRPRSSRGGSTAAGRVRRGHA